MQLTPETQNAHPSSLIHGTILLDCMMGLFVAVADVAGWRQTSSENGAATGGQSGPAVLPDSDMKSRFTAIYFHAKHRFVCLSLERLCVGTTRLPVGRIQ